MVTTVFGWLPQYFSPWLPLTMVTSYHGYHGYLSEAISDNEGEERAHRASPRVRGPGIDTMFLSPSTEMHVFLDFCKFFMFWFSSFCEKNDSKEVYVSCPLERRTSSRIIGFPTFFISQKKNVIHNNPSCFLVFLPFSIS